MGKRHSRSASKASKAIRKRKSSRAASPIPLIGPRPDRGDGSKSAERIVQQLRLGIDSLRAGRLADAAGYLKEVIRQDPTHAAAHNCLGIVHRACGDTDRAIASYEAAIRANPKFAEAHNNLGIAHEFKGDNDLAVTSYRAALACKPDFAAAHNNLGNALTKQGFHVEAITSFEAALSHKPEFAAAINNRGLALRELGHHYEAESSFRQALGIHPEFAEAYLNLGNLLRDQGSVDAAEECFRQALRHKPRFASAHACLGTSHSNRGRWEEAVSAFQEAVRLSPHFARAWLGLAAAQKNLGLLDESIESHRRAIEVDPNFVEARNNLGNALAIQGKIDEAIEELREAVEIAPDHVAAHNNLGNLYRLQDRLDEAAASYAEVLRRQPSGPVTSLRLSTLCPTVFTDSERMDEYYQRALSEWSALRGAATYTNLRELLLAANEPPYNLQFSASNIRQLKQAYAEIFEYRGPRHQPRSKGEQITVGFVVTAQHEIAFLRLIWDALKRMNAEEFQLVILCTSRAAAKFRAAVGNSGVRVIALPEAPDQMAETVRGANLDVLYYFEIGTDAINYFLPFFRLAPVQCTSWGIQVTSGIPNVDYYLSSDLVEPESAQDHYSEKLILASTLLAYQTEVRLPSVPRRREAFGFASDQTIYLCAQHLGKFHTDFDPILGEILRGDPKGVVVLTKDRHGYGAKRLEQRFQRTIPDVASRVIQLSRQSLPDYLSLIAAADVLLDAPHFSGVNTTYDAIALDQPIVSLPSRYHRGRYTLGCYKKMGFLDCVADSVEAYVRIAKTLGRDPDYREVIRDRLRERKHHVFRDEEAVQEHQRIFRELVAKART